VATTGMGECQLQLELRYLNFLATVGPCSGGGQPMLFVGIYEIEPSDPDAMGGVITLIYTTSMGEQAIPVPGQSYAFQWIKLPNGNVNMSSPIFGGDPITYVPVPPSPIAGTWVFNHNGQKVFNDMGPVSFLSYTYNTNVTVAMGPYEVGPKRSLQAFYAYAPDPLKNTYANGTYSLANNKLSLDMYIQAEHQHVLLKGVMAPSTILEGTWSGVMTQQDSYCLTFGDFHGNFYRGFQTRCSSSGSLGLRFGTFLGNFAMTKNQIDFTYAFVDVNGQGDIGIVGTTIPYSYTITYGRVTTLTLTQQPAGPDSPTLTFTKLS